MANKSIGVVYNWLHHLIPDSPWEPTKINQPRLERINKPSQNDQLSAFSRLSIKKWGVESQRKQ